MNVFVLASRNVRKSVQDYGVYFFTIMLGVSLFYIFNSIGSQSAVLAGAGGAAISLAGIDNLMGVLSVFVAAVLGFLILYANAFLIRRRKKEFGLYTLLGMRKGRISAVLICETFSVGLLSLIAGLILGVFLSQGMALITAKMLDTPVHYYAFVFSAAAMIKSICCFGVIYLIVVLLNTVNISRQKLLHLLYTGKRNTLFAKMPLRVSVAAFTVSAAMIAAAYWIMLHIGIAGPPDGTKRGAQLTAVLLGLLGTFLFFFSLSGLLLRLVCGMKGVYFKGLNMLTVKHMTRRIHTTWISMSFICLMLFLAIFAISTGHSLSAAIRAYSPDETQLAAGASYMSVYIGMTFLLACAGVLSVAQLSEASDNQEHYRLLSKLGADGKMMAGSIFRQVLITFSAPFILAAAHSFAAILVVGRFVKLIGDFNILSACLTTGAVILLIYGGYFGLTYRGAKKIILKK